ncbi:MAG TPA: PilT/PilU family type 4a pilus ATPase [Candidatus Hydrothermia bacterium]|nr:PilT/PilU family type 4a pilus ATPase [Candidatus Hydrothermae bacterium]MDD3649128.1 PilT/PilU family type 4a pilus ATPase [Candidatus Hydrothermia bacterium]MDD5572203.1 PilT/PilU family type 4a pilus ATPase [Candidatus Hydrothermia bacterium]HOK23068.1 PilT/PilU family type 4a pilus ATPase [Candidatus Hydrothermia bacterium]HOL23672.1 PilT/PilU family type 4a pilus ATPase [Candidatus Hydrothermia bacterium]
MAVDLEKLLIDAKDKEASDIHIKVGHPPIFRIYGKLYPKENYSIVSKEDTEELIRLYLSAPKQKELRERFCVDFALNFPNIGRFRVNIYSQRGTWAFAIRAIPPLIKNIQDLNLPQVLEKIALEDRGLIIVTGVAGSGKSTTLAAMLNSINMTKTAHIVTIEDPIEYMLRDIKSIISQREVGLDVMSFADGLREALRQDPNVIMVGEIRDQETAEIALLAAETGHLVMTTLHTLDARETINRIVSIFPAYQQEQIRHQLASVLKAIISQRLIPRDDMPGRVPACEIMTNTARIREMMLDSKRTHEIFDAIADSYVPYGMQTFDQSLYYWYKLGLISEETALTYATKREVLELRIKGIAAGGEGGRNWEIFERMALRKIKEKGGI